MIFAVIFVSSIVILTLVYLNGKYNENYWQKRGVAFYKKNKVTGLVWDFLFQDKPFFQLFDDIYKEYANEPAVALGSFLTPALYVKDPVNVNHVLQADFHNFNHRGIAFIEDDKLAQNVLMLYGPKWKLVRQSLTPLFTTAKLKNMYYIMDKSAQDFVQFLKMKPEDIQSDGFQICNAFCCAAITASVFGIGRNSTFDSPFIPFVQEALHPTFWKNIKFALASLDASLFKTLRLSLFSVHEDWFIEAIKQVIRQREKENVKKNDFADLCVSLQKKGTMKDPETGYELEPTDELLAAQAFFFFLAGLEPSASAMFSTIIEVGRHPEILQRVHEEIDETFEKYNGLLTYDAIMEMKYLDNVINEAMRMYPPIGFLTRECVQNTVLPVGNIKVDKGTKIFMPIYEIHHDTKYYKNPEVFDPERFSNECKVSDASYMPFGRGNRVCIGLRFAKLQIKAGIVHALRRFTVNTTVQTGGIKYKKEQVQVRLANVDFEFIPRKS
ncbi:Uncharacterized protein OBRU01_14866 [Operophtera brumata]|uniref:unspecific monooxygenase n=1 Tax=Operophtera brumata TaxID=104452 RepID=A0A0L7L600_OPEBR|nr:Uncharacterized protein OBRU01_14866 [Operophtera brumata]